MRDSEDAVEDVEVASPAGADEGTRAARITALRRKPSPLPRWSASRSSCSSSRPQRYFLEGMTFSSPRRWRRP